MSLTCQCGKTLTADNVCPLIRGEVCTGQHVPPRPYRGGESEETAVPVEEIEW